MARRAYWYSDITTIEGRDGGGSEEAFRADVCVHETAEAAIINVAAILELVPRRRDMIGREFADIG